MLAAVVLAGSLRYYECLFGLNQYRKQCQAPSPLTFQIASGLLELSVLLGSLQFEICIFSFNIRLFPTSRNTCSSSRFVDII